jgi:3-hydroxyacyl-CoA dehydrogenase
MSYAIVGFGKIDQAIAHAFARKNINVTVTSRQPSEASAPQGPGDWTDCRRQVAAGCTRGSDICQDSTAASPVWV